MSNDHNQVQGQAPAKIDEFAPGGNEAKDRYLGDVPTKESTVTPIQDELLGSEGPADAHKTEGHDNDADEFPTEDDDTEEDELDEEDDIGHDGDVDAKDPSAGNDSESEEQGAGGYQPGHYRPKGRGVVPTSGGTRGYPRPPRPSGGH